MIQIQKEKRRRKKEKKSYASFTQTQFLHTDSTTHTRSLVSLSAEVTSSQITYLFSFYIRSFFKEIHVVFLETVSTKFG